MEATRWNEIASAICIGRWVSATFSLRPRSVGVRDFLANFPLEKDGVERKGPRSWVLKTSEGEKIEVRATIRRFSGFSAHAKANDLDVWLERQDRELTRVMLVHGEASALEERQSCLRETGWQAVDVPISGNRYVFRAVP
jgi:hypothetical protein